MVANLMAEVTQTSTDAACGALVSHVQSGAEVRNVEVRQTLASNSTFAAGIAGVNDGTIVDCRVSATGAAFTNYGGVAHNNTASGRIENSEFSLTGQSAQLSEYGGIAKSNAGTISNSRSYLPESGITLGGSNNGGIVSEMISGLVENCQTVFNSTGNTGSNVGGIAGRMVAGEIIDCTSNGKLISGNLSVGGVVGVIKSTGNVTLSGCTSSVNRLEGVTSIGGMIGYAEITAGTVTVENCISDSSIQASNNSGGFIGNVSYLDDSDGTAVFAMDGCHSYGLSVTGTGINIGGMIGRLDSRIVAGTFRITDCSASTNVSGNGNIGGFIGFMDGMVKNNGVAVIEGCSSTGNTNSTDVRTGGFIGFDYMQNNYVKDCIASGSTIAKTAEGVYEQNSGGFVGLAQRSAIYENCEAAGNSIGGTWDVGGFAGRADNVKFKNCVSSGNLTMYGGGNSGGFVGYALGVVAENCVAGGNFYYEGEGGDIGGFVGIATGKGTFRNCTSYGNVNAAVNIGGFVGRVGAVTAGNSMEFTECKAYGNVTGTPVSSLNAGGFVGIVVIKGDCSFTDCEAYGTVNASRSGGFMGCMSDGAEVRLQRCKAYGDVYNYVEQLEAGGFWAHVSGGTKLVAWDCEAYGSVANRAVSEQFDDHDTGGFFGRIIIPFDIQRCISYAPSVKGEAPNYVGGFLGTVGGTRLSSSVIKDCKYVSPANFSSKASADLAGYGVTASGNSRITDTAEIPENPKKSVSCAVTATADAVNMNFTNFVNFATGITVSELHISVNEGRNYTQLVYDGKTLVKIGANAIGGSLPAADFSYSYSTREQYDVSVVRVRVVFSDGFTVTYN